LWEYDEVDLISRISAGKLPNYPSSHLTPNNISRRPQHINRRYATCCSARVLLASYSRWECREMLCFLPSSSVPSMTRSCLIRLREKLTHQAMVARCRRPVSHKYLHSLRIIQRNCNYLRLLQCIMTHFRVMQLKKKFRKECGLEFGGSISRLLVPVLRLRISCSAPIL